MLSLRSPGLLTSSKTISESLLWDCISNYSLSFSLKPLVFSRICLNFSSYRAGSSSTSWDSKLPPCKAACLWSITSMETGLIRLMFISDPGELSFSARLISSRRPTGEACLWPVWWLLLVLYLVLFEVCYYSFNSSDVNIMLFGLNEQLKYGEYWLIFRGCASWNSVTKW